MKRVVIFILLSAVMPLALALNHLTGVRVSHLQGKTRIVFSLQKANQHRIFALDKPERLVIDLPQTLLKTEVSKVDLSKTLIHGIRAGQGKNNDLRLVLDLNQAVNRHDFWLTPSAQHTHRLVLDLSAKTSKTETQQAKQKQPPQAVLDASSRNRGRDLIVVIDPGHGGKDPGAIGSRGTREKHVVLSIGTYLQQALNRYPGVKVYMTRSGDHYIPLRQRLAIARKYKADVFVSVHADSFKNSKARGASVYALSQRGATSESARWLAQKENESEMLGGAELSNKSYLLRSVLIDMSQTATINNGLLMGSKVLANLKAMTRLHSNKVEQAAFVVLKSPDIPSILVENGFISNPYEERSLRTSSYRQRLADAIARGIVSYFKNKLPPNTKFTSHKTNPTYVVKRGDTLSEIAVKNGTSTRELIRLNQLKTSQVRIGQKLRLP